MKKGRLQWTGLGVMVVVAMILVLGAGTATAAGIKKNITIAPSGFVPENNSVSYSLVQEGADFYLALETAEADETACFFAPITFQKGALFLTGAWIFLSENPGALSTEPSVQVQMVKVHLAEGTIEVIAQDDAFTFNGSGGIQKLQLDKISQNEVIADGFAYQIKICVNDGVRIHGIKVQMKN